MKRLVLASAIALALSGVTGCGSDNDNDSASTPTTPTPPPSAPTYQALSDFQHGLALVEKDGKWGAIDTTGNLRIPTTYEKLKLLPYGHVAFRNEQGKWGVLNANNQVVVQPIHLGIDTYADGILGVNGIHRGSRHYINVATGQPLTADTYHFARSFEQGRAAVMKDGAWSYLDQSGNTTLTLDPQVYRAYSFTPEGLALVRYDGPQGTYGYINQSGQPAFAEQFRVATDFSEGLAAVSPDGLNWGYINPQGEYVIQPTYRMAAPFSEGLASVQREDGRRIYIDQSGKQAIAAIFDAADSFSDGMALVHQDHQSWYINAKGQSLAIAQAKTAMVTSAAQSQSLAGADNYHQPMDSSNGIQSNLAVPYRGGMVMFRLINYTNTDWTITLDNKGDNSSKANFIPGAPAKLKAGSKSGSTYTGGYNTFVAQYPSGHQFGPSGSFSDSKLFSLKLDNGSKTNVTFTGYLSYKNSNTDTKTTFLAYLKDAVEILKGVADVAEGVTTGSALNVAKGLYDIGVGIYDTDKDATASFSVVNDTKFYPGLVGNNMNSITGDFAGDDQYIISDGGFNEGYVAQVTVTRPPYSIPEVQLQIHTYAAFYAVNAAKLLNDYRGTMTATSIKTVSDDKAQMLSGVFANFTDLQDDSLCSNSSTNYMDTASAFVVTPASGNSTSSDQPALFWQYASSFSAQTATNNQNWAGHFFARCGGIYGTYSAAATVTASSAQDGYQASYAYDNDSKTEWRAASSNQESLTVDFGGPRQVKAVVIHWGDAISTKTSVDASSDGKTWQSAGGISLGGSLNSYTTTTLSGGGYFTPQTARYFRFTFDKPVYGSHAVAELEFQN
ncbi:MAG: hypothetical protein QG599_1578 [Pseudomonadota bacterium]|nr:hypothetical protein [Pseudomonadota bacterium]